MTLQETLGKRLILMDGGTGTLLQARGLEPGQPPERWNIERRDDLTAIHRAYYDAGSDLVVTNTFGANRLKLRGCPYSVKEVVTAAVENLRAARDGAGRGWLGLDVGPTGHLLAPAGELDFQDACCAFREVIEAGAAAGADAVVIETMTDLYEMKAAVLAARECCSLPVIATAAFGENGRLLTGGSPAALVALLEGLGVSALGVNCGSGPFQLEPVARELLSLASVPVVFKPNAGLPCTVDGCTRYDIGPEQFAGGTAALVSAGALLAGGCCGTTPEHIAALRAKCEGLAPPPPARKAGVLISSGVSALDAGALDLDKFEPIAVPGDADDLLDEVFERQDGQEPLLRLDFSGGDSLAPLEAVEAIQEVSRLPLWLEGAEPGALEPALRRLNGKALVTILAKQADETLPLLHQYGGAAWNPETGALTDCRRQ